jgi:hypothetical protein
MLSGYDVMQTDVASESRTNQLSIVNYSHRNSRKKGAARPSAMEHGPVRLQILKSADLISCTTICQECGITPPRAFSHPSISTSDNAGNIRVAIALHYRLNPTATLVRCFVSLAIGERLRCNLVMPRYKNTCMIVMCLYMH